MKALSAMRVRRPREINSRVSLVQHICTLEEQSYAMISIMVMVL